MKTRATLISLAFLFAVAAAGLAEDMQLGTWKLNEAKSKFAPGSTKNHTVVYEAVGDKVKVTVDGTDGQGKPVHSEWTGKYDGKDYPVTGSSANEMRSLKKVDDHTLSIEGEREGKKFLTGRVTVAADGKSRVVRTTVVDPKGKKVFTTAFYDKQ